MAGGLAKTFGTLSIVTGALLVLAGLGAAGYGYLDERSNQEQFLADPERSGVNEMLLVYGLVGAGIGLGGLVLGLVSMGVGGSQERRDLVRTARGADSGRKGRFPLAGIAAFGVVAALAVVWALSAGGGPEGLQGMGERDGAPVFEAYSGTGSTGPGVGVIVASWTPAPEAVMFKMPDGAVRSDVNVSYDEDLRILFEAYVDGAWTEVARATGAGPAVFVFEGEATQLRVRAFTPGVGATVGAAFAVHATFA